MCQSALPRPMHLKGTRSALPLLHYFRKAVQGTIEFKSATVLVRRASAGCTYTSAHLIPERGRSLTHRLSSVTFVNPSIAPSILRCFVLILLSSRSNYARITSQYYPLHLHDGCLLLQLGRRRSLGASDSSFLLEYDPSQPSLLSLRGR